MECKYEAGKIYTNYFNSVWQVIKVEEDCMYYIFLPGKECAANIGSTKLMKFYKSTYDDQGSVKILPDYQYDGCPCLDCFAFCKQQCFTKLRT